MDDHNLLDHVDAFHRARVLIVGDIMLDCFVYGAVERISPEAPIPVMAVDRQTEMPGGAANVARNVATLGGQAVLIGVVGTDTAGQELARQLARIPTIEARLVQDASRPTTVKTRYVADRQQILRTDIEVRTALGAASADALLQEVAAALPQVDVVILSDYAKGVLHDEVAIRVIQAARQANKKVLVDPKSKSFRKYAGATVLTPNRHELRVATGLECDTDEQVAASAKLILAEGLCDALVVTRGKDGMSVADHGATTHIRTEAREVFDVSGAGDTAVATMALGLAVGGSMIAATRLANVAAGIVVGKIGTATVTTGDMISRLTEHSGGADSSKYFSLQSVEEMVSRWRTLGLTVAFTNGCFDLLHPGHISLLGQARKTADKLVVGLNSDLSVRRLKGAGRPAQSEVARATVLMSLKSVDAVVIFEDDTPLALIKALQPDVLVKGADYTVETVVGAEVVLQHGGKVVLAELLPTQSTSNTIQRIVSTNRA